MQDVPHKEEFQKYLEKAGVIDQLTILLVNLYESPERPDNALEYIRTFLGSALPSNVKLLYIIFVYMFCFLFHFVSFRFVSFCFFYFVLSVLCLSFHFFSFFPFLVVPHSLRIHKTKRVAQSIIDHMNRTIQDPLSGRGTY